MQSFKELLVRLQINGIDVTIHFCKANNQKAILFDSSVKHFQNELTTVKMQMKSRRIKANNRFNSPGSSLCCLVLFFVGQHATHVE